MVTTFVPYTQMLWRILQPDTPFYCCCLRSGLCSCYVHCRLLQVPASSVRSLASWCHCVSAWRAALSSHVWPHGCRFNSNVTETKTKSAIVRHISVMQVQTSTSLVTVSDAEREREREREKFNPQKIPGPAGIWTPDLLTTTQMLLPLSHWAHCRGTAHKLHLAALCGGLRWIPL